MNNFRRYWGRERGFTLIELLVVLVIDNRAAMINVRGVSLCFAFSVFGFVSPVAHACYYFVCFCLES